MGIFLHIKWVILRTLTVRRKKKNRSAAFSYQMPYLLSNVQKYSDLFFPSFSEKCVNLCIIWHCFTNLNSALLIYRYWFLKFMSLFNCKCNSDTSSLKNLPPECMILWHNWKFENCAFLIEEFMPEIWGHNKMALCLWIFYKSLPFRDTY